MDLVELSTTAIRESSMEVHEVQQNFSFTENEQEEPFINLAEKQFMNFWLKMNQ
ncbi:9868_t:CDS:2 [Gigaspora rosea]|nr:9868_t:CDS:2 [Gigaspora rosea]